jgi:hypothetical protein
MGLIQGADVTPTTQVVAAVATRQRELRAARGAGRWNTLQSEARSLGL